MRPVHETFRGRRPRRAHAARKQISRRDKPVPLRRLLHPPVGWKRFFRDLWGEIQDDQITNGAAAVAYYSMFAIFPAAIFLLSLLPYLPIHNLDRAIMDLLRQAMPSQAAELFTTTVESVVSERREGLLSFGFLATLWAASSGIVAVMDQLNVTYDVKETRPLWKTRGLAMLLLVIFGALVITSFGLIVFGGVLQEKLAGWFGLSPALVGFFMAFRWVVILALLFMALATIYYVGPNLEQRFRFVSPGSLLGVVILVAAALGFRAYAEDFGTYEATYGGLGAAIVLLLWLYVVGLVVLVGAEINALLESYVQRGGPLPPEEKPS